MKRLSFILLALMAFGTMAWAQTGTMYPADSETQLNIAIGSCTNADDYINVTDNITLSSYITIPAGKTITINLGGHTLKRNLNSATNNGCIIVVAQTASLTLGGGTVSGGWNSSTTDNIAGGIMNKGTLTLNNVTITNCKGDDGGGIYNANGATLNITGGTISYCESNQGGGGLVNKGYIATIIDCTFDNNTATTRGGAIWSDHSISTGECTFINNKALAQGQGGDGGAIHVESSTFTLVDDIITGNSSKDAGGIYVKSGATLNIHGNTLISGNESTDHGGGGIVNYGTVNMLGGTITNNTCHTDGAGIWNNGTLTMQGDVQVKNNIGDDVFLKNGTSINVGSLTSGQNSIGIRMETPNVFTAGYGNNNQGNFNHFFSSGTINPIELVGGECKMFLAYYECTWDNESKKVVQTVKKVPDDVTVLNVCTSTFASGGNLTGSQWFIADGTGSTEHGLTCGSGDRHLILCDGASITINEGFFVNEGATLHIYCQSFENKMGKLISNNTKEDWPGIGGKDGHMGTLIIHGGDITASGGKYGAGIGGRGGYPGKNITIYGGKIKATGGEGGAGIGGGSGCKGDNITIYGGTITANGGKFGAGIGGGDTGSDGGCNLTIHGGTINATGGISGAGIGSGEGDCEQVTITINGGTINAKGGPYSTSYGSTNVFHGGAGIGGGERGNITSITINGGNITATAQNDGAGIGSGPGADQIGTITIIGGVIHAYGGNAQQIYSTQYGGAGIGGGGGDVQNHGVGGPVIITGGTIYAQGGTGQHGSGAAIGHGGGSSTNGSLGLPENYSVKAGENLMTATLQTANNRESGCRQFYALVEPCVHEGSTCTDNGNGVSYSNCSHCITSSGIEPYTFKTVGYWNDNTNWFGSIMPGVGKDVKVTAAATIPNNYLAHVGNIDLQEDGSLTIADGGQLIHTNTGVVATMEKRISAYSEASGTGLTDGWYFIASPISAALAPGDVANMITNETAAPYSYDLYRFNQTADAEWENYHQHSDFNLVNGAGYLYANSSLVTLGFTGELKPYNASANTVTLAQTGWNLIGNPFTCAVVVDKAFAELNNGTAVTNKGANNTIMPCAGIAVNGAAGDVVTFTAVAPDGSSAQSNSGLQIALSQANTRGAEQIDNAIISFNEGSMLPKFHFGHNAELYIPQGTEDYAIAFCEKQGEMPLNFMATQDGEYTLSINPEGVELGYLHLIDNITGADVDLLATPSYTFTAKTTDYASRFRLVFSANGNADDDSAFAFISNGNIIVNAGPSTDSETSTLQVIDALGRQLLTKELQTSYFQVPTSSLPSGVYVLCLINGENLKTQKIIIQ